MPPLQICILHFENTSLLEQSLQSVVGRTSNCEVLYFGEKPESPDLSDAISLRLGQACDDLAGAYLQAFKQTTYPLLILQSGEILNEQDWEILTEQLEWQQKENQTESKPAVVYAQVKDAQWQQILPRLFFEPAALQGQLIVDAPDYKPQVPLLQIQLQPKTPHSLVDSAWLEHLAEKTTPEVDLWLALGIRAFAEQDDEKALKAFTRSATATTESEMQTALARLAQAFELKTLWETQSHETVFERLEVYRQETPLIEALPGLWLLRGVMARRVNEIDLAIDCFAQATLLPQRADFYDLNRLLVLSEISWKPLIGQAELELKESMFAPAYLHFKAALEYLPNHDYLLTELLKAAFFTRRYDTVREIIGRESSLRGLSELSLEMVKLILDYDQASPELIDTLTNKFCETAHKEAFELSVMLELAIVLLQQAALHPARKVLERLSEFLPAQVLLWHNLAYSYFAEGKYAEAEAGYRKALTVNAHFPESRFDLAKTLVMQNRSEEAQQELQNLLELHPNFEQARRALKQLENQDLEALVMPTARSQPESESLKLPFIFVFPVFASWEQGADLALKAYYQEFVAEDNVLLVFPQAVSNELIDQAQDWAEKKYPSDLLPPVALLPEPLPLLEAHSAWLLPWRLHPGQALYQFLSESGYPLLCTQSLLPNSQAIPAEIYIDHQSESQQAWQEIDLLALQNQMRLLWQAAKQAESHETNVALSTHSALEQPLQAEALQFTTSDQAEPTPAPIRLTVCLIVKDEAEVLNQCLDSVHDQADEIIVVDTGSQDQSREIAAAYAKVKCFEHPWKDDFAEARNAAFEKASGDWVLFLDADEFVGPDFIPQLRLQLMASKQPDAYCFRVNSVLVDGSIDPQESLSGVPRLFPNDNAYRFEGRVHEVVYHAQKTRLVYFFLSHLSISHVGYRPEVIINKDKIERDRKLMLAAIAAAPEARSSKRLYAVLARDYVKQGDNTAALKTIEKGLEQVHDDDQIRYDLFYQQQQLRLSQQAYQKVLDSLTELDSLDARGHLLLSQAQEHLNLWSDAFESSLQALQSVETHLLLPDPLDLRPHLDNVLRRLAYLAEKQGDLNKASYYFKRLLKIAPQTADWKTFERLQQSLESVHY